MEEIKWDFVSLVRSGFLLWKRLGMYMQSTLYCRFDFQTGKTKIVLLAYNNIGQFLGNGNITEMSTARTTIKPAAQVARRPCSDEPVMVYQDLGPAVNSRVLSVSINDPWETTPLAAPVNLTFEHAMTGDNASDPVCSFWKFDNT